MNGKLVKLGQVMETVERMSKDCHDQIVPVRHIEFNDLDSIRIDNAMHTLRPMAQRSLSYRLGVPFQYLKKCPPELQATNLNHWLAKERNEDMYLRFDSDVVRAVFTPRYVPVDNMAVLRKLQDIGFEDDTEVQCHLDQEFMSISIIEHELEFMVNNNDKIRPGISIGNSEVGLAALSISAYLLRLVCTNGLISKTEVEASYRHISRRILDEFPNTIGEVRAKLVDQKRQFQYSLESEVKHPIETVKSFNRQFQLGKLEVEAVEWAWPQEQGETMFHVINTYTKAAQYRQLTAEGAYRLQRVGGMVMAMLN